MTVAAPPAYGPSPSAYGPSKRIQRPVDGPYQRIAGAVVAHDPYVAALEAENARLRALAEGAPPAARAADDQPPPARLVEIVGPGPLGVSERVVGNVCVAYILLASSGVRISGSASESREPRANLENRMRTPSAPAPASVGVRQCQQSCMYVSTTKRAHTPPPTSVSVHQRQRQSR